MKKRLNGISFTGLVLFTVICQSCNNVTGYDLAIRDANIFDARSGEVVKHKTILVNGDTIVAIIDNSEDFVASKTIDAAGRLVSPGFIDTHTHLADIIGNYDKAPEYIHQDSVNIYHQRLAETYLKYGVTVVKDVGSPEKWLPVSLQWQKKAGAEHPDFHVSGSAIISDEERRPYMNHAEVVSPEDAAKKVIKYDSLDIRYIKAYWRLREQDMKSLVQAAKKKNMNVCAHVDNGVVTINKALDIGIKHFEHSHTITNSIFPYNQFHDSIDRVMEVHYPGLFSWLAFELEVIRFVEHTPELREERQRLIKRLADEDGTISSTTHLFASACNRAYFKTYLETGEGIDNPSFTKSQLERVSGNFDLFMAYIKSAHDQGVPIRIGTDCPDGGKALLSELILFCEAGLTLNSAFQIATINGARAMGIDKNHGSIEVGKKANMVIFEQDPFKNFRNLLSKKIIIKDGKEYDRG